jgi:hypothetical protein
MKSFPSPFRFPRRESDYQPWIYFFVFALTNSLLAYGSQSWAVKSSLGLVGLLFPFLWALFSRRKTPPSRAVWDRPGDSFPWILWIVVLLGALAVRFYQLTTYLDFPLYDEIVNALYAIPLNEKWDWNLFFGGLPPFYIWLLSLGFKVLGVSFTWLWILPALLSLLSAAIFYAAARRFFCPIVSMGFLILMSVSFWPVFAGRFSHQALLMGFWESVTFWGLAVYFKDADGGSRKMASFVFGLWVGLGFYTYFGWPLVALLVLLTLGAASVSAAGFKKGRISFFVLAFILALLPLWLYKPGGAYLEYLNNLLAYHKNPELPGGWNPLQGIYSFTSFFWNGRDGGFAYNPVWGGWLNPLLGSLFFLGLIEFYARRSLPLVRWFFAAFAVLFFPILLANNTNGFHVLSLMPLFLIVTAVGLRVLYSNFRGIGPKASLLGLLLVSSLLDWGNLEKTRLFINAHYPAPEMVRVYQLLKKTSQERGPGLVFSDLWLRPWPPFLGFATTPFNVLLWKGAPLEKGSWAALVANVNYQPFLKKIFPDGKAYWISKDLPSADGGIMLWIMPVSRERLETFALWQKAAQALEPFWKQYALIGPNENRHFDPMIDSLNAAYPFFQGDPFLESIYWEIRGDIDFRKVLWKTSNPVAAPALSQASFNEDALLPCLQDYQYGIKRGYPAANFYYQMGTLESMAGQKEKALKFFKKAAESPLDFTDSFKFLRDPNGAKPKMRDPRS